MGKEISHQEIAERFLQSEALNFDALGKFVSSAGPELLVRDSGWHGVNFGRFNILACMLTGVRRGAVDRQSPGRIAGRGRDGAGRSRLDIGVLRSRGRAT